MTPRTQMILGMHLGNGYGSQASAWRAPGVDPANYTSFDAQVRYARAAERGKFAFLFLPDFLGEQRDLDRESLMITLDPMLTLAAIARETTHIGLVAPGRPPSTSPSPSPASSKPSTS